MERKLNAFTKHKWRSQPDLGQLNGSMNIDYELHNLCVLSGIKFDIDVFQIIIDLLRLNVNPNTLLDVLRKMATQSSMQKDTEINKKEGTSSTSSADISSSYLHLLGGTPLSKDQKDSRKSRSVSDIL